MTVIYCRHRRSNHGDCVSVKYLLQRRAGVGHLLSIHVDDVSVAMVALQQHLEHRQVDSSPDCFICESVTVLRSVRAWREWNICPPRTPESLFLSHRTARSTIGYWHDNVVCLSFRLSVRMSVTLCIVAKRYNLQQKCRNK